MLNPLILTAVLFMAFDWLERLNIKAAWKTAVSLIGPFVLVRIIPIMYWPLTVASVLHLIYTFLKQEQTPCYSQES